MTGLTVTKLDIHVIENSIKNVKAYANVTFNNNLKINGLKVIEGKNGLFVGTPNYRNGNGKFRDIVYFPNKTFREEIQENILTEYDKKVKELSTQTV